MTSQRFEASPCSFIKAGPTTVDLTQMENFSIDPGAQHARVRPAGSVDGLAHILATANPIATFGTRDLDTYFTHVSPAVGLACPTGATFRLQERDECAVFLAAATATHMTFASTKGCLFPNTLQADQDSAEGARLESTYVPFYNNTVLPFVINDGVNFATAPAAAFNSLFFLGPVYINGVEIPGVISVNVDFGLNFQASPTSPGPFPHTGSFIDRNPTLSFTTRKMDEMDGIGNLFANAAAGDVAFYFQKGVASGERLAKATAQHCKVTAAAGEIHVSGNSNQAAQDATVTYMVKPTSALATVVNSTIP